MSDDEKKPDGKPAKEPPEALVKYLELSNVNGQSITDEPAWLERVAEISAFLPEHVLSGLLSRINAERGDRVLDISGFAKAFQLTPAEEKLVTSLAQGRSVPEHAEFLKISVNTARVHMQRVLDKTAASGQLDLVRLLHSFK